MNDEQDRNPDDMWKVVALVNAWALALQLPLRRRIGKRILGFSSLMALLGTLFYGGLFASLPVLCWSGIYLMAVICHRVAVLRRYFRGDEPHSYFVGYSWITTIFCGRLQDIPVKTMMEPALMLLIAFLLSPFGEATFIFFAGGAICMVVSSIIIELRTLRRQEDMRDAIIEGGVFRPTSTKRR